MKNSIVLLSMIMIVGWSSVCWDMQEHEGHNSMNMSTPSKKQDEADSYKIAMVVDGIRAEFEVMPLTSMGLLPVGDAKHHVMVRFFMDSTNQPITKIEGKLKIISPSKKAEIFSMRNYRGLFVTNFAFIEKGNYVIICTIKMEDGKVDDRDHIFEFQYIRT